MSSAETLKAIYRELAGAVEELSFDAPTTHVYNPLQYARKAVERYLELAGGGTKEAVFLGMNPGPWGMAQTGVPFGTVSAVRDWLEIETEIGKPSDEHPKRPVCGFDTEREEVSGQRFWGWAKDRFETPGQFFERFFVHNYCPLMFMEESGRNRTPDKLRADEKKPLFNACDAAFRQVVDALEPRLVVAIGQFAEERAKTVLADRDVRIGRILHPSPASPAANRGWREQAEEQLAELGVTF